MKIKFLSITAAGLWITFSEFIRNEFFLKSLWIGHFESAGLKFQTLPVNGILWMIWSFSLAYLIYKLLSRFSFIETVFTAWLPSFAMMWITIYNLQVLPVKLLITAVPLSIFEIMIAIVLIKKIAD